MKMYQCKLVDKKGFVKELFYREGENEASVLEDLKCFKWSRGKWIIEQA